MHSALLFFIAFAEVFLLNINIYVQGYHLRFLGYPWGTERVFAYSGFIKMPNFTNDAPNVYFFNYGELIILSIVLAAYGSSRRPERTVVRRVRWAYLASFAASMAAFLYIFVKVQVLQSYYLIGNTLYYPAGAGEGYLNRTLTYYHLSPSRLVAYYGGAGGLVRVVGRLDWDELLVLSFAASFVSLWQYFDNNKVAHADAPALPRVPPGLAKALDAASRARFGVSYQELLERSPSLARALETYARFAPDYASGSRSYLFKGRPKSRRLSAAGRSQGEGRSPG